jgi:predicted nuclease with TOPRIM domain
MHNTKELFEKIYNDLEEIHPENLFNFFEDTLAELTNSSERLRAVFFGSQESNTTQTLEKMRNALSEISSFPDHLFKMIEYDHSVRLSDFEKVNPKKIKKNFHRISPSRILNAIMIDIS